MARNLTSYDQRKKPVVIALKKKSGGTKVTLLKETGPGVFEGKCHALEVETGCWDVLGTFTVTAKEAGITGAEPPAVRAGKRCGNRYTGASLER